MSIPEYSVIIDNITCTLPKTKCTESFDNFNLISTHFKTYHFVNLSEHFDEKIKCGVKNCNKSFKKMKSYGEHINTFHTKYVFHSDEKEFICRPLNFRSKYAKMIADAKFSTNTSAINCDKFIDASFGLMSETLADVQTEVERFLKFKGIDTSSSDTVNFLKRLSFCPTVNKFKSLNGHKKALKENYTFIEPIKQSLGRKFESKYIKEKQQFEIKSIEESFQYVPIIETIKLVLSNKEVFDYIQNEKESSDGFIRCYRDSEAYKKHPFFSKHPNAIRILLYYDDFLINNPLGSKTHGNKIGAFYMHIQNLLPQLQRWRGIVHLVAFCYTADVTKYGISTILVPFMQDIVKLESELGVTVNINNKDVNLHGTLVGFCGDTLAAHSVLGFLGPSANKFCRICTISRNQLQVKSYIEGLNRSKTEHEKHVEQNKLNQRLESETGVREDSTLHRSFYFHCTGNFILDFMHDYLEGVAAYTIKLVIAHYVHSKDYDISIELLHDRIHLFNYGFTESSNRPSETFMAQSLNNPHEHTIKQRSAQCWCLLRILPFLISDKVKEDDKYLKVLLTLSKTLEIIAAPKIYRPILPYFQTLIYHYDELFRDVFKDADFINKLHHLFHYLESMLEFGPMTHYSCFLPESENRKYKEYASSNNCYKDLTKTLTTVSQISHCSTWGTKKENVRQKLFYTYANDIDVDKLNYKDCVLANRNNFNLSDKVRKVKKIKIYSTEYIENIFVAIDSGIARVDNMPVFGKIIEMFISNNDVYFVCEEWITEYFKENLNAYCVTKGSKIVLIKADSLCDEKPFNLWNDYSTSHSYICLRYLLF